MNVRLLVLIASFGVWSAGIVHAEDLNPVVGKAGDYVLREADLDRLLDNLSLETQKAVRSNPEQRTAFVKQLLLTKATAAKARKDGFDRKPDFKELVSNVIDNYLAQEYLSKVVTANITVTDEELKKYYSEHEKEFLIPEAAKVRHIFIASTKDAAADLKAKGKAKAEGILQQISKGDDFAKLAKEQSEDADSAAKGGDLGYISAGKTNSPEFEKAIFALKAGEPAQLIETSFGYHIVKIDERKEQRTATFDEAKEYMQGQIKEQIKQEKAQEFLETLTRETGLTIVDARNPDTTK
ncbi:peptidylprolyl isomerase [Geobacter pelophilus]|uniref:Peptidylprolyl isomerase n=1 Tax=Geoanaerobacter pelophilus TaxID=60036 RepID=A0AAW4L8X0_9BACT|nr:peptidylprolyl isomerase [Geoanaerobacter pelophilus]MBT0664479.1 peptidylprolyl isomerase [Geoanaerobacter pelophilus]